MCYATHRVIDGVLALVANDDVRAGDVTQVHATVGTAQASMLRNHAPRTGLEAKFGLEFAVTSALVARKAGLRELTDEFSIASKGGDVMTGEIRPPPTRSVPSSHIRTHLSRRARTQ